MLFSYILALAATFVSAAPTCQTETLLQWQLQSLDTFSPSGRPGSSPYSTINITVVDANTIPATASGSAVYPASQGICSTQWTDSVPWNEEIPCTSNSTSSAWSFKLLQGTSGTTNFTIDLKLVDNTTVSGTNYTRTWTGGDHFEVGDNLEGQCGGSGVCAWSLRAPTYAIEQYEQRMYRIR